MNFGPHPLIVLTPEQWKLRWSYVKVPKQPKPPKPKKTKEPPKPKKTKEPPKQPYIHNYSQYL